MQIADLDRLDKARTEIGEDMWLSVAMILSAETVDESGKCAYADINDVIYCLNDIIDQAQKAKAILEGAQ